MIAFDQANGVFIITDLGRIAAKYYIRHSSIEIYNKEFRPKMTEADVLAMLSMSTEVSIFRISVGWMKRLVGAQFDQIQIRETEVKELEQLMEIIPCAVKVSCAMSYLVT
jgi:antiviral helicase SLH1